VLAGRVPEFLAILVHHVIAGPTLDPTGPDFDARVRQLIRISVSRVNVIEARVKGTDISAPGEGSEQELFLDAAEPAIHHDLKGDNWR